MFIQTFHHLPMQISREELMFFLDQRQKIDTKRQVQISGLDRKATTKIAKTLKRRVRSCAQEAFMEFDSHKDSDPGSNIVFSDNSTKSTGSSISDEPYLSLNVLLSGMKVVFFIELSTNSIFIF